MVERKKNLYRAVREKKQRDRERVGIEKCDGRSHRCKLFRITFQNAFLKYLFHKNLFKIIFYIFSCINLKNNFKKIKKYFFNIFFKK
jgi:hypothetical protein